MPSGWPQVLEQLDLAMLHCRLDFETPCTLRPADLLAFGQRLRPAAGPGERSAQGASVDLLLRPPLSSDPVARRRFQKPAPAFVLRPLVAAEKSYVVGDSLDLRVLFVGTGVTLIHDFLRRLIDLGRRGLVEDGGCFEVLNLICVSADGTPASVWRAGQTVEDLEVSVLSLDWLTAQQVDCGKVRLRFTTPSRLLVRGRPLRRPRFDQVFPFMLRRVTSMLHAHAGLEPVDDATALLALARQVAVEGSELRWQDWRDLVQPAVAGGAELSIGGFVGSMDLSGAALGPLCWVLALAALFGVGKGAAYGAGHIEIQPKLLLPAFK
jgi:hypothetical protein